MKISKSVAVAKILLDAGLYAGSCHERRFGSSAFDLAIGHEAPFRLFVGQSTNSGFREMWGCVKTDSDYIQKALRSGWLQQFEIFYERGLLFGRSHDDGDQDIFATDDLRTYMERLSDATHGGYKMMAYAFKHGLDRPNLLAKAGWGVQGAMCTAIETQDLPMLKLLLDKCAAVPNGSSLFDSLQALLKLADDRDVTI
ncbi:hypothetical protein HK57_00183 [Aspergillus ustus]|uniref:Uncharacterized protein n=1 Tax=Aspergillus ustus TaxID=40382 RepID=A0A0C1EFC1_ASPUT|nr:hypothetical protein HK57_00183 [Aspergillus ustus]